MFTWARRGHRPRWLRAIRRFFAPHRVKQFLAAAHDFGLGIVLLLLAMCVSYGWTRLSEWAWRWSAELVGEEPL